MAKGYLVANVTVTDAERFAEYRAQVSPLVERYGGRYLIRGGTVQRLEGEVALDRVVVIEFESIEAARRFYDSAEYRPVLALRTEAARSQVALVEGI